MPDDDPQLPLRIVEVAEAFSVEDAIGRKVAFVYFEQANGLPNVPRRFTKAAAKWIAQTIARGVTDRLEDEEPEAGG
jgi:hypothetical protein